MKVFGQKIWGGKRVLTPDNEAKRSDSPNLQSETTPLESEALVEIKHPHKDDKSDPKPPAGKTHESIGPAVQDSATFPKGKTSGPIDENRLSLPENNTEYLTASAIQKKIVPLNSESKIVSSDATKLSHIDRIVVLMGPTGVGKSTFIEYATRQGGSSIGHTLSSQTSNIRAVRFIHPKDGRPVIFVDTPGFDDANRSDIEISSQIAGWLVKVYKEHIPLAAIVYLHRISDNRMGGSPLKNLHMFASMCGQQAMPCVVLGTTMWSEVAEATGERREKELARNFWVDMIKQGCRMVRFEDSYESAWDMVGTLEMQEYAVVSREIVDEKKGFNDTAAGLELNHELMKLISDQKEAIRQLEEQAGKYDNPVLVEELQARKTEIEKRLISVAEQIQRLKIPWKRKLTNWFSGSKKARASNVRSS